MRFNDRLTRPREALAADTVLIEFLDGDDQPIGSTTVADLLALADETDLDASELEPAEPDGAALLRANAAEYREAVAAGDLERAVYLAYGDGVVGSLPDDVWDIPRVVTAAPGYVAHVVVVRSVARRSRARRGRRVRRTSRSRSPDGEPDEHDLARTRAAA